ncbi:MAG: hypothetical protein ACAH83_13530 [Alphaproteobacteria bacterium]
MFGWVKKLFNRSSKKVQDIIKPEPISLCEQNLKSWGIEYYKQKDGLLVVPGNLNISNRDLTELPDFSTVVVKGNFSCLHNHLTSLKGAPRMFASLVSDFGIFWEGNIPQHLRQPPPPKPASGSFQL